MFPHLSRPKLSTQAPSQSTLLHSVSRTCLIGRPSIDSMFGAIVTRIVLGFAEAAFFPGAVFLISTWYKRSEIGLRMSLLVCGSMISNAFGALFASVILDVMEGGRGPTAWRYTLH